MSSVNQKLLRLSGEIEQVQIGDTWLMKQRRTGGYLLLDQKDAEIILSFDGKKAVNTIFKNSLIEGEIPRVSEFYALVQEAIGKGLLFEGADEPDQPRIRGHEWPFFCTPFSAAMLALLLIVSGSLVCTQSTFPAMPKPVEWFVVLLATCLTLSFSSVLAAIGLRAYRRQIYLPGIRIYGPLIYFSIDARDAIMGGRRCEQLVALCRLAAPGLVLLLGGLTGYVPLYLAGLLIAMLMSMPFGESPVHELLYAICRQGTVAPRNADSFVRNNLFCQLSGWKQHSREETYFIIFSTYTILWLGGAFHIALILLENLSVLVFSDTTAFVPLSMAGLLAFFSAVYTIKLVAGNIWRVSAPKLGSVESAIKRQIKSSPAPDIDLLAAFLEQVPLFTEMSRKDLREIAGQLAFLSLRRDTLVIREHDPGEHFFVIYRGLMRVLKEDEAGEPHEVARLGPGDVFGEIALLEKVPRNSSVISLEDCELMVLSLTDFERLLVARIGAQRIRQLVQVCSFLRRNQLFSGWSSRGLIKAAGEFVFEELSEGTTIIEEGTENEFFYLVYEGELDVFKQNEKVASLGPGDFCGEISLLRETAANATVKTARPSRALKLDKDTFLDLVDRDFVMAAVLDWEVSRRDRVK